MPMRLSSHLTSVEDEIKMRRPKLLRPKPRDARLRSRPQFARLHVQNEWSRWWFDV